MNRTRKVFLVIMVCVVMLFATACGNKDNTPFKHGTWSGSTYTSEFFGLRVQIGSDWKSLSESDLAKSAGISDMSDSNIKSAFDKGGYIYDMMAIKSNGSSMNITIQDNEKTVSLSEKDFFTAGIPIIKAQFEAAGYKCSAEKDAVSFLGKTADCINLALTANNTTVYEILIPVFKSHYTACITFGSLNKSELYTLLSMVTAI